MPDETIEARLDAIEQHLEQATIALDACRTDLRINQHIESANTVQIDKLKRHVADLQSRARVGTIPAAQIQPTEN